MTHNPIKSLVPFVHVANVARSIDFYHLLGFEVAGSFTPDGENAPVWVSLESANASLMIARADEPVDAAQQAVMFYIYCDDVAAKHAELQSIGMKTGPVATPFYNPKGEFRIVDPDGYTVFISHT